MIEISLKEINLKYTQSQFMRKIKIHVLLVVLLVQQKPACKDTLKQFMRESRENQKCIQRKIKLHVQLVVLLILVKAAG